jgi:hypothetical protein
MPLVKYTAQPTHETLHAIAWLSGDPAINAECRRLATQVCTVLAAAEALEAFVRAHIVGHAFRVEPKGLATDLLLTTLGQVDWLRIADQYRTHP